MIKHIAFLYILFVCAPVMAQDNALKPLPDVASMEIETFVSHSNEIRKTFDGDAYIQFEVQLPKTFTEQDVNSLKMTNDGGRLYGELYRSNGQAVEDVYPYFSLKSYKLERTISAKNWLVTNLLKNGQTLRSLEVHDDGDSFETMFVRFDTLGNTEIVRAKGYLRGPRMIMAEYVLPVLVWNEQRDQQTYAIKSFELSGKDDAGTIEPMQSYAHLNSFSVVYPNSWILNKQVKNEENRIDLFLKSADELRVIFAEINLSVVSTKSLRDSVDQSIYPTRIPDIIKARKSQILDKGFLIGDVIERLEYDLAIDSKLQITEVYPLRKKLTDYVTHREAPISHEFWVTVIKGTEDSGKSYILSMLVPSRQDDLDNWAVAAEAYKIMIESIR